MPLDLPDYKDLSSMYSGPLAARMAQDNYDQKGRLAQMLLEQQQQSNQSEAAMAPLKQQFQQGQNDAQAAQLPGLRALARNHQLTTDAAEQTHDAHIADELGKYQGLKSSRELQQITQAANAYGQIGGYLGSIPGPARVAAAKQMLGSMWRPEFEQYSPQDLPDVLSTAGKWMGTAQTQYQQALGKQESAQASKETIAADRSKAQAKLAEYRAGVTKAVAGAKAQAMPTREKILGVIQQALMTEQDPDKRAVLQQQYDDLAAHMNDERVRVAKAAAESKVDPNSLGMKTPEPSVAPRMGQKAKPGSSADNPIVLK